MKKNLGNTDRVIRIVVALLIGLAWMTGTLSGLWETILAVLAIVFLVTGAAGFCPVYASLKLSSLKKTPGT